VELGVNKPQVYVTADPAFLLKPATKRKISEILKAEGIKTGARPAIGVTLSSTTNLKEETEKSRLVAMVSFIYMLGRYFLPEIVIKGIFRLLKHFGYFERFKSKYITRVEVANIIDHIINTLNVDILIIPHIYHEGIYNDSDTAQEIRHLAKNQDRVNVIQNVYTSEELKGIIGICDMYISSRMHAAIAAISQCVPTILIPVGNRHHGIMRMMGQGKYVCNSFTFEEMMPKVVEAWTNRETIKHELQFIVKEIQEASLRNAELVKTLLNTR
jgi:polysaccharide pyruvyl transferase WcaK-like protein